MAPTPCQLLIDPPADGTWNMAVDEVLLAATANSGLPTLRLYQWQSPTLSLGYFQKYADRSQHRSSLNADVVRRLSGGGAILHDQELTYSLLIPASHNLARDTQSLYDAAHQAIIETLNTFLAPGTTWQPVLCEQPTKLGAQDEPFLCFERRSKGDILLRNRESDSHAPSDSLTHKIVGSAQRRRQGVVLQHGSILLGQSARAPELEGFADITRSPLSPTDLLAHLPKLFAKNLSLKLIKSSLSQNLTTLALDIQRKKYQAEKWTKRR